MIETFRDAKCQSCGFQIKTPNGAGRKFSCPRCSGVMVVIKPRKTLPISDLEDWSELPMDEPISIQRHRMRPSPGMTPGGIFVAVLGALLLFSCIALGARWAWIRYDEHERFQKMLHETRPDSRYEYRDSKF